ncbi:hypothetical protein Tco_1209169 [Tanacetum coccineum]
MIIIGVIQVFEQAKDGKEDSENNIYAECKDISPQRRALIDKFLDDEDLKDYESHFQPKLLHSSEHKPKLRYTKDFKAKYTKVKAKLALLSSSASFPKSSSGKNKGLIAESYEWNEEEVSSDENETIEVKALMTLTNEERVSVSIESANNGEWVKISIQKVHTLLEMEDNDDRKSFLDYLYID